MTIVATEETATMSIQVHFGDLDSMEKTIEGGFERGLIEMLNGLDPLIAAART